MIATFSRGDAQDDPLNCPNTKINSRTPFHQRELQRGLLHTKKKITTPFKKYRKDFLLTLSMTHSLVCTLGPQRPPGDEVSVTEGVTKESRNKLQKQIQRIQHIIIMELIDIN